MFRGHANRLREAKIAVVLVDRSYISPGICFSRLNCRRKRLMNFSMEPVSFLVYSPLQLSASMFANERLF